ncbi:unnamed protein product [Orchesella dallaii]|uniref:Uncharacterized protein n=1 Tax=Orchesella dallaii TaxID=48710 RepID=A0ABP1RV42_9HEXA
MVRTHIKTLIFILLATFNFFTIIAEFPKECFSKLFPSFNKEWEKYVLYFVNNKEPLHDQPSPENLISTRIVVAEDMKGLDRGAYRLSDTFNVIIQQLEEDYMNQMNRTRYLNDIFVPSRSIFLFITSNNSEKTSGRNLELANWHKEFQVFSALKLILTLPQPNKCNRNDSSVIVICSGYCSSAPQPVADFEKGLANAGLHAVLHSLFWNGNRKVLPAIVHNVYSFIEDTPKEEQGVCLSQTNRIHYKCTKGIMTMLTYGKIHNLTMDLKIQTITNLINYGIQQYDQGPELITDFVGFHSVDKALSIVTQLKFGEFDSRSCLYCPTVKHNGEEGNLLEFGVWGEPFSPGIWLTILSIFIFGIGCCYIYHRHVQHVFQKLINYWAAVFGAQVSPRYFILVSCFAFLLSQIYSNGLTSIITVGKTTEGFKTIEELLQAGYKILFNEAEAAGNFEDTYGNDFKRMGLPTEGAFEISYSASLYNNLIRMSQKNARLALVIRTSMANLYIALSMNWFQTQNLTKGIFTCFVAEQTMLEAQTLSILKSENQYWLYVTSQRLRASGLHYKWNEWSRWHHLLNQSLLDRKHKEGLDFINLPKFLVMQLVWGALLTTALAIFCVETKLSGIRQGIPKGIIACVNVICNHSKRLFRRQSKQPSIIQIKECLTESGETHTDAD